MANAKLTPVMLKVLRWMAEGQDLRWQLRHSWMPCWSVGGRPVRQQTADALRLRQLIVRRPSGDMAIGFRYHLTEAGKAASSG